MRPILLIEDDPSDAMLVRDTLEQVNLVTTSTSPPTSRQRGRT